MERLLAFIEKNFHLILFLVLQMLCVLFLFKLNPYQQAAISNSAIKLTATVNGWSSNVKNYFHLTEGNVQLQRLVADTLLSQNPDYQLRYLGDTFELKDSNNQLLYKLIPAQVVYNSINKAENVFVINKGSRHGVDKGSGVVSSDGVAGIVVAVGQNFSTVMSVLNVNFKMVPMINGVEFFTDIIWDNQSPYSLRINKINKLENVSEGDVVRTGYSSLVFPPNIPIGKVVKTKTMEGSQYFDTEITTATNFRKLRYVFVVNNDYRKEVEALLNE